MIRLLAWCLLGAVFLTRRLPAEGMALLVPAYFAPSSGHWDRLAASASRVPLIAIANLYNGPGQQETGRAEDVQAMRRVRTAGGQVLGYVYTQYGRRALALVKADMQRWHDLYPIDGFFVDEMSNQSLSTVLDYYSEVYRYARGLNPKFRVLGNPGTNTEELYLRRPVADALVIFENHTGYSQFTPAVWTKRYSATQFGHLTYAVATPELMTNYVRLAETRRAGFVYVTDDAGDNPWDTLPTYWEQEVSLLEGLNTVAATRLPAQLALVQNTPANLTLTGRGAVGRYVLEGGSPLGVWERLGTNLTNTGTSVWQILRLPPDRFFRIRQE